jgi:hypothetical protein
VASDGTAALSSAQAALAVLRRKQGDRVEDRDVVFGLMQLARLHINRKDLAAAHTTLIEALAVNDAPLAAVPSSWAARRDRMVIAEQLGRVAHDRGDVPAVRARFAEALAALEWLAERGFAFSPDVRRTYQYGAGRSDSVPEVA